MKRVLASVAWFSLAACGDDGTSNPNNPDAAPPGLTYHRDVKPIVDAKCVQCHTTGGIAPFTLTSFGDFDGLGGMIKEAVTTGIMPPWLAADGCNDYFADRSLTDEQIAILSDWIDQGMPEGDAADQGPPLEVETVELSREDVTLTMPVAYTPQVEPDDYRCFLIDWPRTETSYVTGFRADPGDARVVHHVIAFYIPPDQVADFDALDAAEEGPGYTCFGGPGGGNQATGWLGSWAPGSMGSDYPAGTGYRVEPGSKVALQVHYNTLNSGPIPDQTSIAFKIDPSVEKEAYFLPYLDYFNWLTGDGMLIPANEPDVMHSFEQDITGWIGFITDPDGPMGPQEPIIENGPFTIHAVGLHMHTLGTSATLRVNRASGDDTCLLDIPRWDFHWQGGYGLREPVVVSPGDQLYIECHWDNTAANQQIVNGEPLEPREVTWGEGTTDEMCLGGLYITSAL